MEDIKSKLDDEVSLTSTAIANTWNSAHEELLAGIADRANCMRWMHNACNNHFELWNFWLTVPTIAISTVTGSATIGLSSLFPGPQGTATTILGMLGITCGILNTLNQYMKTSQYAESNRIASLSYGKLHRLISNELALRRDQRCVAMDFLKLVRQEQDRLQETSPTILQSVIHRFNTLFKTNVDLERPEITGDLEHAQINRSARPESGEHTTTPELKQSPIH